MICRSLVIVALLAMCACAPDHIPMAATSKDEAGKQFTPPPDGRAAVYVVQTKGPTISMGLGQRNLGLLSENTWLRVDVPPGEYDARCNLIALRDAGASLPLSLRAGETAFVSTNYVPLGNPSCRLHAVDPAYGRSMVLAGKRIQEVGGASD